MREKELVKTIHKNEFGNLSKCSCCNEIQLSLGNVILTFSEEEYLEFDLFFDEIRRDVEALESNGKQSTKYIIRTNRQGVTLSLSHQELKKTIELLDFSKIIWTVNQLIR